MVTAHTKCPKCGVEWDIRFYPSSYNNNGPILDISHVRCSCGMNIQFALEITVKSTNLPIGEWPVLS